MAKKTATSIRSREERLAEGRALRDKTSRRSHASWKAPANRPDPVAILMDSNKGRLERLLPIRYGRMMQSPFAFYRGAAAIMASDLADTPASGLRVQACGDCHLMNFGGFATPERRIVFGINDFDETLPAPWEWDLKRLACSFVIAARHNGFAIRDARDIAASCARSYREHCATYAEMPVLERWYEPLDAEDLIGLLRSKKWKKTLEKQVVKESSRSPLEHEFPKLAQVKDGKARIKDSPPLIYHLEPEVKHFDRIVREAFRRYRSTLADDRKVLLDQFVLSDIAASVVGVGSVGTRCAIVLMMAGLNDPLFLQVKEARTSVLEPYAGKSVYASRGQRVVSGQRLMQVASDVFLGWTEDATRHFYIRQLRDVKIKPVVEVLDERAMSTYANWCGWALARSHAKSGDSTMTTGYLGRSRRFDDAIVSFAVAYADQNERDHQALLKAIRAGKVKVQQE
jgi:uncharacterized protein (DUF2252 family)